MLTAELLDVLIEQHVRGEIRPRIRAQIGEALLQPCVPGPARGVEGSRQAIGGEVAASDRPDEPFGHQLLHSTQGVFQRCGGVVDVGVKHIDPLHP